MGAGSEADLEADTVLSPEHPVRLWGRSTRSGRSSCLSSRANSNLTLTDTEHENTETGECLTWPVGYGNDQTLVCVNSIDFLLSPWGSGEADEKWLCLQWAGVRAFCNVA